MRTCRLSLAARLDFLQIYEYISKQNPDAADELAEKFEMKCRNAAEYPLSGSPRPELGIDLRSFSLGVYLIFYRPVEEGIEVVRFLHGARDIDTLFNPDA